MGTPRATDGDVVSCLLSRTLYGGAEYYFQRGGGEGGVKDETGPGVEIAHIDKEPVSQYARIEHVGRNRIQVKCIPI